VQQLLWWKSNKHFTLSRRVTVTLIIQHAMRMRHIILSFVACAALHFWTLSHKWYDFRGKKLLNIEGIFNFLCNFYVKHFYSKKS